MKPCQKWGSCHDECCTPSRPNACHEYSLQLYQNGDIQWRATEKNSYKTNSGKYYVTIKADPDAIPVQPALGQHWSVKGHRLIEEMETGDYVMQQHTYESPEHIECSQPETGEQLIRFIARESDFKGIGESKARALWELLGKNFHPTVRKTLMNQESALEVS